MARGGAQLLGEERCAAGGAAHQQQRASRAALGARREQLGRRQLDVLPPAVGLLLHRGVLLGAPRLARLAPRLALRRLRLEPRASGRHHGGGALGRERDRALAVAARVRAPVARRPLYPAEHLAARVHKVAHVRGNAAAQGQPQVGEAACLGIELEVQMAPSGVRDVRVELGPGAPDEPPHRRGGCLTVRRVLVVVALDVLHDHCLQHVLHQRQVERWLGACRRQRDAQTPFRQEPKREALRKTLAEGQESQASRLEHRAEPRKPLHDQVILQRTFRKQLCQLVGSPGQRRLMRRRRHGCEYRGCSAGPAAEEAPCWPEFARQSLSK